MAAQMTRAAFHDALRDAVAASGLQAAEATNMHQRLHDHSLDSGAGWWHFQAGAIRTAQNRMRGLNDLKDLLVGAGLGPRCDNTDELLMTLSLIADTVTAFYAATPMSTAAPAPADPGSDDVKLSKQSYNSRTRTWRTIRT